ncbi:cadherin-4-like, partial [Coregonus clupeaformis]|uniref:cadherin-4-like n=1 Tax=Coregonus clupeaformis TaxID=59861 RepID=UPI001E1C27D8
SAGGQRAGPSALREIKPACHNDTPQRHRRGHVFPMPTTLLSRGHRATMKFEDCQHSKAVDFESSDPNFSVRPDGSVYTEQEVANLSEPVQFMVTARGGHDPHIWETTVKLALAGHPPSVPMSQIGVEDMIARAWDSNPRVIKFPRKHQRSSSANGLRRQKRDWVIPPINVPENSRGPFPQMLVR